VVEDGASEDGIEENGAGREGDGFGNGDAGVRGERRDGEGDGCRDDDAVGVGVDGEGGLRRVAAVGDFDLQHNILVSHKVGVMEVDRPV
jgi:hypothetical protein